MKLNSRRASGFTLVELIIVVAIVAVLSAVAIPSYRDYIIRTRVSEAALVSQSIRTSVELYASRHGRMPSALGSLSYVATTPASYATEYIGSIGYTGGDTVVIHFISDVSLGNASGGNLSYTAAISGALVNWTIGSNDIRQKYWPD